MPRNAPHEAQQGETAGSPAIERGELANEQHGLRKNEGDIHQRARRNGGDNRNPLCGAGDHRAGRFILGASRARSAMANRLRIMDFRKAALDFRAPGSRCRILGVESHELGRQRAHLGISGFESDARASSSAILITARRRIIAKASRSSQTSTTKPMMPMSTRPTCPRARFSVAG